MKKIFIAGHNGMVGSAIHKKLSINSDNKIFTQKLIKFRRNNSE